MKIAPCAFVALVNRKSVSVFPGHVVAMVAGFMAPRRKMLVNKRMMNK